jgi:hypothetical protein
MNKTNLILAVFFFCILILSACGAPAGNTDRVAYNTAVNVNSNTTIVDRNGFGNADANKSANTMSQKVAIDKDFLTGALKTRLQKDGKNADINPVLWENKGWLAMRIGVIYKDEDESVLKAVREVSNGALALNNAKLTEDSWKRLSGSVSHESVCETVVNEMVSATSDNEQLFPQPVKP